MAITGIQRVTNLMDRDIMFLNTEYSGNNRSIPANSTQSVSNAWVPWCTDAASFPAHHMQLIDTANEKIFAYIWQHAVWDKNEGDFVRVSPTGYEDVGTHLVESGSTCDLIVQKDGKISVSNV